MGKPKRIGVLTSGGDCAGLNAALRAVVLRAAGHYGWDVIGIRNGTAGLLQRPVDADILQLEPGLFDGTLLRRGGTLLGRSEEPTSELPSLMRISYAVFRLKKKTQQHTSSDKYITRTHTETVTLSPVLQHKN